MASIEQRISALEKRSSPNNFNLNVVFCKGSKPTDEERAKSADFDKTIFVTFVKCKGAANAITCE